MLRTLLVWGLIAGLCGGLLATGFAELVGESAVDQSIAVEDQKAAAAGEAPGPELVSRDLQKSVGLLTAAIVYGLALGGIFAIVFAVAYGRVGRASPAATALLLALGAFVVIYLVPFLKYPANPPSVGSPDTIGHRTAVYFLLLVFGVLSVVLAVAVQRRLVDRLGGWNASILAAVAFLAVVVLAYVVMPSIDEVPEGFPADVLWKFRVASLGTQAVLWTAIGLGFGALTERHEAAATRSIRSGALVGS
jgi:predicted cobalt transporter CbtA